ncbi:histone-lysine N-methyltransferase SETMAR [Trichonephila clavipes]|nr:histone-lysine N-methyltransferase SETMAR [Trichonephila clavipes]
MTQHFAANRIQAGDRIMLATSSRLEPLSWHGRCKFTKSNSRTKEKMELMREHHRTMIFYDFTAGLNQDKYVQRLQLEFGDESPCYATVFRRFKEFFEGRNSLQGEEHKEGRSQPYEKCYWMIIAVPTK